MAGLCGNLLHMAPTRCAVVVQPADHLRANGAKTPTNAGPLSPGLIPRRGAIMLSGSRTLEQNMNKIIHRADSRGLADHGWLRSRHTFSFASYHNPDRMHFGKLRVLNDDVVAPGGGFGTHPHDNMEIVSVPLSGALQHKDSMGNVHVIRDGEVQIMSAGTGLTHSEYNNSKSEPVNFLQIWVIPKARDITPRYGQKEFDPATRRNRFQTVVSPDRDGEAIWINQDAYFSLADIEADQQAQYAIQRPGNGAYIFVIAGEIAVDGERLGPRDAMGITGVGAIDLMAVRDSQVLVIDVPMN